MQRRDALWLIILVCGGVLFCNAGLVSGQTLPGKKEAPSEQPTPNEPAARVRNELPDDPMILKKFDSPAASEKWLDELEKLYVPPKWSEKPKLSEAERDQLEIQRESAYKKVKQSRNADEYQTRIAAVLHIDRRLHGAESEEVINTLQSMVATFVTAENWPLAKAAEEQIFELTTKIYGHESYHVQDAKRCLSQLELLQKLTADERQQFKESNNLYQQAEKLFDEGKYSTALPLAQTVLATHEKILGPDHPDSAMILNSLGELYNALHDYARAEPLYKRALKIRENALGSEHPNTATSLSSLAILYTDIGDYARAEALFTRALQIKVKVLAPDDSSTALTLNNLAALYYSISDYARAETLLTRAVKIKEKALGPDHRETANGLGNLAELYHSLGKYERAEALATRALNIREKVLGSDHPNTALSLNNLAELYRDLGDDARAEPLLMRALKIREKTLGPDHHDTGESLKTLGYLHMSQQQPLLALPQFERAFQIELKQFHETSAIQSERQQQDFAAHFQINGYLQALLANQVSVTEHYAQLMLRKGLVFRRQQALRSTRDKPQLQPVFIDWQRTMTQLSQAALKSPLNEQERENLQTRVNDLTTRKEELETQLAKESQEFAAAQQFTTLAELQAALPKNALLVDCMFYGHRMSANAANKTKATWEARLAAFIIPAQGEVQLLDLGLAEAVEEQLALWLGSERSDLGQTIKAQAAGLRLREQLWEPLSKYLPSTAAGKVPLVLLSPDGVLNQIPWNALPGAKPGTYLLEEAAITIIPVPQLLPGLLNPVTPRKPPGKLLVLGDVDYDLVGKAPMAVPEPAPEVQVAAVPRGSAKRDADAAKFAKLPGTRGELETLEKLCRETFGSKGLTTLQQQAASKAAVQHAASQHTHLHLATHGFFAADNTQKLIENKPGLFFFQSGDRSLLSSINPNLLCGIVLAGANVPQAEDDGILTAEEVLGLELRGVQLTTLSACETGMGTTTSGEGLLGLQRAFQVAGCQTVVASQWSVDDAATRALMERFYTNMWVKKLPKLAALREAQLWMLREGPNDGVKRGLAREGQPASDKKPQLSLLLGSVRPLRRLAVNDLN